VRFNSFEVSSKNNITISAASLLLGAVRTLFGDYVFLAASQFQLLQIINNENVDKSKVF
jgi:hypothetical protein